jgi:hypothetical protein
VKRFQARSQPPFCSGYFAEILIKHFHQHVRADGAYFPDPDDLLGRQGQPVEACIFDLPGLLFTGDFNRVSHERRPDFELTMVLAVPFDSYRESSFFRNHVHSFVSREGAKPRSKI